MAHLWDALGRSTASHFFLVGARWWWNAFVQWGHLIAIVPIVDHDALDPDDWVHDEVNRGLADITAYLGAGDHTL